MVTAPEQLCKQPSEKRKYGMEFNSLLTSGETISSITSINSEKIDGSATDLSITSSGIQDGISSSSRVTMWIESGTHGGMYRVEVLVTTSGGQILEGDGLIRIIDR